MAGSAYVGKAGQLAVMAEFAYRGYNVAMPEIDVGDDVFVVEDRRGEFWRIQVRTADGKRRGYGYSGKFAFALAQLRKGKSPDLHYVLALRTGAQWEFVPIPRNDLYQGVRNRGWGSRAGDNVILTLRCHRDELLCSGSSLQRYRNNWERWPLIRR
jgi:hypothetical protein